MATAAKKVPAKRIYSVSSTKDHVKATRLIRATSGLQALAFATKGDTTVRMATQDDLLGKAAGDIEEAVETPPTSEPI